MNADQLYVRPQEYLQCGKLAYISLLAVVKISLAKTFFSSINVR